MSLIQDYMSQRRKKKLEEVNHALEQLKHENVVTDSLKPKGTPPPSVTHPPLRTGKDLLFIGILLICVIVLIITTFYYRGQYASLNDDYQEKVDNLKTLQRDLEDKINKLETTREEKNRLEASEDTLQEQTDRLEAEIEDLEAEISKKEDELTALEALRTNLTRTVTEQQRDILHWRNCIEDELDQNLSVCD